MLNLFEISRIGKSAETESRLVAARGWEEEGMGSDCLVGYGLSFWNNKKYSGSEQWSWLHNIMNVQNAPELYTWNG